LSGPRHGGQCDRVEALVREVGEPERAAEVIASRARRGEMLPGFGHRLYVEGDPRTPPLLARAEELAPKNHAVRTVLAITREAAKHRGEKPTVDLGLVALSFALGAPPGSAAGLFALGRTAGWVAHVIEQREAGFMLRPRARYVGALRARSICDT
jgi:citrate synthase